MLKKTAKSGRRGLALSLSPLTPEQAISAMFKTSKTDVARIIGKKRRPKAK
jgi:hypothetical protein